MAKRIQNFDMAEAKITILPYFGSLLLVSSRCYTSQCHNFAPKTGFLKKINNNKNHQD